MVSVADKNVCHLPSGAGERGCSDQWLIIVRCPSTHSISPTTKERLEAENLEKAMFSYAFGKYAVDSKEPDTLIPSFKGFNFLQNEKQVEASKFIYIDVLNMDSNSTDTIIV